MEDLQLQLEKYAVKFGSASSILNDFIKDNNYSKVFVLADENTHRHCLPKLNLDNNYSLIFIESGERNKNLHSCSEIWEQLMEEGADRNSLLLNLGGGVIGDMGGFAASTYKRGIDFAQVPTTLLAMVDASVGGKLGVDFNSIKNAVGLFRDPKMVVIDDNFLDTLDPRELRSGMAEVFKHGLISEKWLSAEELLEMDGDDFGDDIIYPSVQVKKQIVEKDPYEKGLRKALNFGHTIGHALESLSLQSDENPALHGEAVAAGMIAELYLSEKKCGFPAQTSEHLQKYFAGIFPSLAHLSEREDELIDIIRNDKKNQDGNIQLALLENVGKHRLAEKTSEEEIRDALRHYRSLTS